MPLTQCWAVAANVDPWDAYFGVPQTSRAPIRDPGRRLRIRAKAYPVNASAGVPETAVQGTDDDRTCLIIGRVICLGRRMRPSVFASLALELFFFLVKPFLLALDDHGYVRFYFLGHVDLPPSDNVIAFRVFLFGSASTEISPRPWDLYHETLPNPVRAWPEEVGAC
ncbi:hypothetical protein VTI74DRAFT_10795 [Chaetomium olivicolor]